MNRPLLISIVGALSLAGCMTMPSGPEVMVLPGNGKTFEQFSVDDAQCRQWAAQQMGTTTTQVANESTGSGAAIGTVVGAAGGAAVGAAAHNPAMGAAVGAGLGLLGGTAVGAQNGEGAQWTVQHRYDVAYTQCMYAKGNQVPVPQGSQPTRMSSYMLQPPPGSAPPPPPPPGPSS